MTNHRDVIFLDCGWGGLSIVNNICDIFAKKKTNYAYIYLPYEQLINDPSKELLHTLYNIYYQFVPKIIVIACHTLSVIYHQEVKNIIDINCIFIDMYESTIELISEKVDSKDELIGLFSSHKTRKTNMYKDRLLALGYRKEIISCVSCDGLALNINQGNLDIADTLVKKYIFSLSQILTNVDTIYIVLCCTHYPFVINSFNNALTTLGKPFVILNPNELVERIICSQLNTFQPSLSCECDFYFYGAFHIDSFRFFEKVRLKSDLMMAIKRAQLLY